MIVVGGWPGRNVIGLNGAFGVRPAAFAVGGSFDSPLLNDVDGGDGTTEFVAVVATLPGSGAVVFNDDGGFSHTGAADGTYTTTFTLYTWAQGGPLTQHSPNEEIQTAFGSGAFTVAPTGIASGSTVGAPAFSFSLPTFAISASSIGSAAAIGAPTFTFAAPDFAVAPAGLASGASIGVPVLQFAGSYVPDATSPRRLVITEDPRLQATTLPGSGGALLQPYPFSPGCHLDIEWDWRPWLDDDDALETYAISWAGDVLGTVSNEAQGSNVVRAWLTLPPSATDEARSALLCSITTSAGRVDSRKYELLVKQL